MAQEKKMAARARGRGRGRGRGFVGHHSLDDTLDQRRVRIRLEDDLLGPRQGPETYQWNDHPDSSVAGQSKERDIDYEGEYRNNAMGVRQGWRLIDQAPLAIYNMRRYMNDKIQVMHITLKEKIWIVSAYQLWYVLHNASLPDRFNRRNNQVETFDFSAPYEVLIRTQGHHIMAANDDFTPGRGFHMYNRSLGTFDADENFGDDQFQEGIIDELEWLRLRARPNDENSEEIYPYMVEEIVLVLAQRERVTARSRQPGPGTFGFADENTSNNRYITEDNATMDILAAGCSSHERRRIILEEFGLFLSTPKTINNNCLITLMSYAMRISWQKSLTARQCVLTKPDIQIIRNNLQLANDVPIPLTFVSVRIIFERLDPNMIYPMKMIFLTQDESEPNELSTILEYEHGFAGTDQAIEPSYIFYDRLGTDETQQGHVYYIKNLDHRMKVCPICKKHFISEHKCNPSMISFMASNNLTNPDVVPHSAYIHISKVKTTPPEKVIKTVFVDIESGPFGGNEHQACAIGALNINDQYVEFVGRNCMDEFMAHVHNYPADFSGTWVAHNGGSFDFPIILRHMLKEPRWFRLVPSSFVFANGKILAAKINILDVNGIKCGRISFWDSLRHIPMALREALQAFRIDTRPKGWFPYYILDNWDVLEKTVELKPEDFTMKDRLDKDFPKTLPTNFEVKKELIKYLEIDVRALGALVNAYLTTISNVFDGVDARDFMTLPQMSYARWQQTVAVPFEIQVITDREIEKKLREGYYGGRVVLNRWFWQSSQYKDFEEKKITFDEITDYFIKVDVNSEYPYAMRHNFYPSGPFIMADINDDFWQPTEAMLKHHYFAEVTIMPNQHLAHSLLPYRNAEGHLVWDLTKRTAFYTSVDLELALQYGYIIEKWHWFIYWPACSKIFDKFIDNCMTIKDQGTAENNPVKRAVGKNIANSCYGKFGQRPHDETIVAINSGEALAEFFEKKIWSDFNIIGDSVFFKGSEPQTPTTTKRKQAKPIHIAAFITAFARRRLFELHIAIDPTLMDKSIAADIAYGDTDSLIVHVRHLEKLRPFISSKLGDLKVETGNDKDMALAIVAPKTYMEIAAQPDGDGETHRWSKPSIHGKGVPIYLLQQEMFAKFLADPNYKELIEFETLKATALNPQIAEIPFAHYNELKKRTWNKNPYTLSHRNDDGTYSLYGEDEFFMDFDF